MSAKRVFLGSLVGTVLGLGLARGQAPTTTPATPAPGLPGAGLPSLGTPPGMPAAGGSLAMPDSPARPTTPGTYYIGPRSLETPGEAAAAPPGPPSGPSSWNLYPRSPGCCGPVGGNGPISYEAYLRAGPSFPIGGSFFGHVLDTGWEIQGGARTLFFNPEVTAAWTVDLSISNIHNHAGDQSQVVFIRDLASDQLPPIGVTAQGLNRTYANAALGREWYLWGAADSPGIVHGELPNWRVGVDVGGRWGSEKLDLNEIRHRTEVTYGAFLSVHSDVEFPCGCCIFYGGARLEYDYSWSNILNPGAHGDLQDLNLLFEVGARF
jgi:hypothetical protein